MDLGIGVGMYCIGCYSELQRLSRGGAAAAKPTASERITMDELGGAPGTSSRSTDGSPTLTKPASVLALALSKLDNEAKESIQRPRRRSALGSFKFRGATKVLPDTPTKVLPDGTRTFIAGFDTKGAADERSESAGPGKPEARSAVGAAGRRIVGT